jgi:Lar family restriction alleviation protein
MAELLPCPFCEGTDIDCADSGHKTYVWFVQCNNCCATFPHFDSEEEEIKAWNTRTKGGGEK